MLPAQARLRRSADFTRTVRGGRRAGRGAVVVHLAAGPESAPTRAGFVVSRTVGNAVVRNQVSRRLRHLVRARLALLPSGTSLVVRALPAAAGRCSDMLATDLDAALRKLVPSALAPAGDAP